MPKTVSAPPSLQMPTPEELGLSKSAPSPIVDWTVARNRLERLNAVCFHFEKIPEGGFRFTCLLPTPNADRSHRVEAVAVTESEAIRMVLEKSEQWAAVR